jgi:hypothetical protein
MIWNINTGECMRKFEAYTKNLFIACFLFKLTRNSIISFALDEDKIKIWNTDTGNCLKVLQIKNSSLIQIDLF